MVRAISDIEAEVRKLDRPDQERLVRALLEELEGPADPHADQLWLEEAQRRSAELEAGVARLIPAKEVFESLRARLKQ